MPDRLYSMPFARVFWITARDDCSLNALDTYADIAWTKDWMNGALIPYPATMNAARANWFDQALAEKKNNRHLELLF